MRLSLRFILPLALTLAAIAYAVIPLVDRFTLQWFVRDLDIRTSLIANTIQDPLGTSSGRARERRSCAFSTGSCWTNACLRSVSCDPSRRMIYRRPCFPLRSPARARTAMRSSARRAWGLSKQAPSAARIHVAIHRVGIRGTGLRLA